MLHSITNLLNTQTHRRSVLIGALAGLSTLATPTSRAQSTIRIGPNNTIKSIASAAVSAKDGDVFEVEAGDYLGDIAVWTKDNITLRAVGGRVRLKASGMAAEGKAIWVVRGTNMTVEGFDFSGARVADKNGAGIRLEKGSLSVRDCSFTDCQNGILTGSTPTIELTIANCEFGYNGHGDGQSHDLYVGEIAKLSVTSSYFHHAKVGHLFKTRAAVNHIFYNRLTDESGGSASYELEFAVGGVAYVVGNIIQQGSQTQNPHLISYAAEGYKWPKNELYLVNNTLVDNRPNGGVFLRVKPGSTTVKAINNLLVGKGTLDTAGPGDYRNNFNVDWDEFELAAREDYRLKHQSKLLGKAIDVGAINGQALMPDSEYVHPRKVARLKGQARHPGALQSLK
jgi:hypothetical protein